MEEEDELRLTQEEIRIVERTLKVHARENSQFHLVSLLSSTTYSSLYHLSFSWTILMTNTFSQWIVEEAL
jgi:hypothetical protein